jgi:alpha-L-fucosidase
LVAPLGLLLLSALSVAAEAKPWQKDDAYTAARTRWWRDAKYGMFIHWGLYAVPAGEYNGRKVDGIGEWIMNNARIPIPEYEKFAAQFNPVKFDARAWARAAKAAGMKYMVITSKHHDGFSMFDTKQTDYSIVKATPFHRDPMKELAQACKEEGIKFGFYHSIMDWHHPQANKQDAAAYIEHMKRQLKELVTQYDPAILWFDGEWVDWWNQDLGRDLESYLHGLKPSLVINNRIGKRKMDDGDYETPEQEIPKDALGRRLWETCMTLNDTWGFKKDDHNWKSPKDVVHKLADIASKGGNFLLNVGPTAEGVIPPESVSILAEAGKWLKTNGQAIYGSTYSELPQPDWGRITRKGDSLYLIVFNWPTDGKPLSLPLTTAVRRATLLGSREQVAATAGAQGLSLQLPAGSPNDLAGVIRLDLAAGEAK